MNKTIGLLAHVDAGKTTFAEQLLYRTRSIASRGRVDHKDAFLDSHELERARGITIFAGQAVMEHGDSVYYLMDTPGHVDFSAEMERALQVMDYAVVIVSAVEGVEGHTETVWQLLRNREIPTFFFINKTDREGADAAAVFEQIKRELTKDALFLTGNLEDGLSEDVFMAAAERDEHLLEAYIEGNADSKSALATLAGLMKQGAVYPVMYGSALLDTGIAEFLANMELLTATDYKETAPFAARVYKIRFDRQGTRLTFMKIMQGKLAVRDELTYTGCRGETVKEKITSIRIYNGDKFAAAGEAAAGQLIAVTGLSEAEAGSGLGVLDGQVHYELVPALKSKVLVDKALPVREVLQHFQMLNAEDPSLGVDWDETLQELYVHVMGSIQLEVLEQVVLERFGMKAVFARPEILYKETIVRGAAGYGHFEPLGHFAEVHLSIEPGPRNSGVSFVNRCHADDLSTGYQNLIGQHVLEKPHRGLLTGSPLTDVVVTLQTGRSHVKHTSGGDFREATIRALRQGLEKAENQLLEPVYAFSIKAGVDQIGKIMTDIHEAHGRFEPPDIIGDTAYITGYAPVASFMDYQTELAAATKGRGSMTMKLAGYEPCHQAKAVIEAKGYRKDADPEYSSSSVFCAKGKGFTVPWQEVPHYLSIEIDSE